MVISRRAYREAEKALIAKYRDEYNGYCKDIAHSSLNESRNSDDLDKAATSLLNSSSLSSLQKSIIEAGYTAWLFERSIKAAGNVRRSALKKLKENHSADYEKVLSLAKEFYGD